MTLTNPTQEENEEKLIRTVSPRKYMNKVKSAC